MSTLACAASSVRRRRRSPSPWLAKAQSAKPSPTPSEPSRSGTSPPTDRQRRAGSSRTSRPTYVVDRQRDRSIAARAPIAEALNPDRPRCLALPLRPVPGAQANYGDLGCDLGPNTSARRRIPGSSRQFREHRPRLVFDLRCRSHRGRRRRRFHVVRQQRGRRHHQHYHRARTRRSPTPLLSNGTLGESNDSRFGIGIQAG